MPQQPVAPSPAVLAPENLPFQLHLLVQAMTRRMQRLLDPFDLTPLHWGMLCCLWRRDGLSATDFAEQLSQLGGTITVALNSMQRRKLIRRQSNPKDGRAVQVFLTAHGRSLEQQIVPEAAALIHHLVGDLSSADYRRFTHTIQTLRNRAESPAPQNAI